MYPSLVLLASSLCSVGASASYLSNLSPNSLELFNLSMGWLDTFYDKDVGYLYGVLANGALQHNTRSSSWYAAGLLARNEGEDVKDAEHIIKNIVGAMHKDPADQWYGDYQKYPEEPLVGTEAYPPDIYNSWDPNWRGFIGTTFIVVLEEFEDLLSTETVELLEASLYNASVGDSYRVGGVDDDNFYPSYSNPAIMSAFMQSWTGRRLNDSNMTNAGETLAHEIHDLFVINNTLSEFNSGTYTGVSLYGLTLWSTYLPDDSFLKQQGPPMISYTWQTISDLWQPQLKNTAGPWDRAYGFDMNKYVSLISPFFWSLVGQEYSAYQKKPWIASHGDDFAYAPLLMIISPHHNQHVPAEVIPTLTQFKGEHTYHSQIYAPPYDYAYRNVTAWLADNITIGAESFDENQIGGPREDPSQFNPAVIQWKHETGIGWITLYATEPAIQATVAPNSLKVMYPYSNASSVFTFLVSTFRTTPTVYGWEDVVGLNVQVSGNVNLTYALSFAGLSSGADETIHDFEFWNFTYATVPGTVESWVQFDLALTQ